MTLFRQWAMPNCFYCDIPTFRMGPAVVHPQKYTRDHLIPVRLRIGTSPTVPCCEACNHKKGNKSALKFIGTFANFPANKRSIILRAYKPLKKAQAEAAQKAGAKIATI